MLLGDNLRGAISRSPFANDRDMLIVVADGGFTSVEQLQSDGCHLWWAVMDAVDAGALQRCQAWLSDYELERLGRFAFERDQRVYLLAHAMLRGVLSRYFGQRPEAWRIEATGGGKPAIHSPILPQRVTFNLSHSQGIALCGVAIGREVGVDVEDMERAVEFAALAKRYFSASEAAEVQARSGDEQRRRFFEYWTLKEAVLKGEGAGIVNGLAGFAVQFGADGNIEATGATGARWELHLAKLENRYALAAALERRGTRVTPRIREWRPPA